MFQKILIANRGEIAIRVMRTCMKMGIKTVAVYSEADSKAPFVAMADESYLLGGSRVNESYLNADKIISIAKESKVDAIHPGYGFLSENGSFVQKCEAAGITFIGPGSDVMEQMGSKIAARNAMKKAGVPIVPGTEDAVTTADDAIRIANKIGYPVMLKASAGGGGIGMQAVQSDDELQKAFANNAKRAENFFGNGAMFLEKKIEHGRHIEIQILSDHYGNAVYLFERECSIQRRNQKVIEEAPSAFISEATRRKMGEIAVKAVKSLHYVNAGTIEFMVDESENFYFLEMNTRIQVEHPITEEITGVDIVEQQLMIADKQPLAIRQEDLFINGHAIEARIYAEDPVTFFPSPGHITTFDIPKERYVRHEVAVAADYDVTPFYDPMIAKLIVTGNTREEAIERLRGTLQSYHVGGIKTNIPMLKKIVFHEAFENGDTTTAFVPTYYVPIAKNGGGNDDGRS
ncbi:acetyl/propionyl/methylcrotonyl-CoA carboxylase subunit alpha [Virgibacillus halophilus]|uniref:acetyl-CoA carboxylase biotin carboxylase subunit n=1 Tax=Tigheibacillus halophilus TaxID=361280 RepID=UPI00363040B1